MGSEFCTVCWWRKMAVYWLGGAGPETEMSDVWSCWQEPVSSSSAATEVCRRMSGRGCAPWAWRRRKPNCGLLIKLWHYAEPLGSVDICCPWQWVIATIAGSWRASKSLAIRDHGQCALQLHNWQWPCPWRGGYDGNPYKGKHFNKVYLELVEMLAPRLWGVPWLRHSAFCEEVPTGRQFTSTVSVVVTTSIEVWGRNLWGSSGRKMGLRKGYGASGFRAAKGFMAE